MYTLRIINQTKVGAEVRRNIPINGEYSVLVKIPTKEGDKAFYNEFAKAIGEYYGVKDLENTHAIDQTIIGFVYANDAMYPIHDYTVVYIVGNEGQTLERVYGIYNKN